MKKRKITKEDWKKAINKNGYRMINVLIVILTIFVIGNSALATESKVISILLCAIWMQLIHNSLE